VPGWPPWSARADSRPHAGPPKLTAVARVLIIAGGCSGRRLAARLIADDHAVRVTTRTDAHRASIEAIGAECHIGDPDRVVTLRPALDHVAIACWMLAGAVAQPARLRALHGSRLRAFLGQLLDTTVRGFLYDASAGAVAPDVLAEGARITQQLTRPNAIPAVVLQGRRAQPDAWLADARAAIDSLLRFA
jgi:nucleoside-diphosphate-sugar epimerase